MHPRGVWELRNLGKLEHRSADGEDFATTMSGFHEKVKEKLQDKCYSYKLWTYLHRKDVNFEVGDMVLSHLIKERFPRGEYTNFKMKKIGPCKILLEISANGYELELPPDIGISPIFNVANLYPYTTSDANQTSGSVDNNEFEKQQWVKQMPVASILEAKNILDT